MKMEYWLLLCSDQQGTSYNAPGNAEFILILKI